MNARKLIENMQAYANFMRNYISFVCIKYNVYLKSFFWVGVFEYFQVWRNFQKH